MIVLLALLLAPAAVKGAAILDHSDIAVVRILASNPGEWKPGPRQTRVRKVRLELQVERALKGAAAARSRVTIEAEQFEPGPRTVAVPGPWSGKPIDPGARYVLFSNGGLAASDRVEAIAALPQIKFVLEADRKKWPLGELRNKAAREALGPVLGEYIVQRLDEVLYADAGQFDALLSWLESPRIAAGFRLQVMSALLTRVISADPVPDPFWTRLAVAAFRVAGRPDAGTLGESILSTYLPNLLGLTGGAPPKSPAQVFGAYPEDLEKARAVAARSPVLAKWIAER